MPILKSAKKALKQGHRNKTANDRLRRSFRDAIKLFRARPNPELLNSAYSAIDTAAKKHLIHKNKAARLKAGLAKLLTPKTA